MNKSRLGRLAVDVGSLLFSALFLAITFSYPFEAKLFPLIILPIITVLSAIQLYLDFRGEPEEKVNKPEPMIDHEKGLSESKIIGYLILLIGLVLILGLTVGISIFLIIYLRLSSQQSWFFTVMLTAGVTLSYYIMFVLILQIRYSGILVLLKKIL